MQEVGRAGRDGQISNCCAIVNAGEYHQLKARALSGAVSFNQVKTMVQTILHTPKARSQVTDAVLLGYVSTDVCAAEGGCSSEVVKSILYTLALDYPHLVAIGGNGCSQLRFVSCIGGLSAGAAGELNEEGQLVHQPFRGFTKAAAGKKRGREGVRVSEQGSLMELYKQLGEQDVVLTYFQQLDKHSIVNIVEAANQLNMTLESITERIKGLEGNGSIKVYWKRSSSMLSFPTNTTSSSSSSGGIATVVTPALEALIVKSLYGKLTSQTQQRVKALRNVFGVLTSGDIEGELEHFWAGDEEGPNPTTTPSTTTTSDTSSAKMKKRAPWAPPKPLLKLPDAVSIIADFAAKNANQLESPEEAAKILLGVPPPVSARMEDGKGVVSVGSWWMSSGRFGALLEFEFEWVLRVCKLELERWEVTKNNVGHR